MSELTVSKLRFRSGIWEGLVTGASTRPNIMVTLLDRPVANVSLEEDQEAEGWHLSIPVPSEALCDGVQSFIISDADAGEKLSDFTIVAGDPLVDDLRAELELLRAELDLLKRTFRRHCLETQ